eukprot:1261422-Amphidinium_carterae.1
MPCLWFLTKVVARHVMRVVLSTSIRNMFPWLSQDNSWYLHFPCKDLYRKPVACYRVQFDPDIKVNTHRPMA